LSISARKAFSEQTDPWNGLNTIYDHLALDYLFPNPQNILTFLDNHDTDRFLLEEPENLGWWKQAMTFLLTSRGIPQLYYGTELLMNGKKEGSDGYVRRDFPGGFPGDEVNAFTAEGRTDKQNEAYNFLSKILNWRKGEANEVIAKGELKHFMPTNGIYLYQRKLGDKEIFVILNGNDSEITTSMKRYSEVLSEGETLIDILSGVLSGAAYLNKVGRFYTEDNACMNVGFQFIVLDPKQILGEEYSVVIKDFVSQLRSSKSIDGCSIILPGDDRLKYKRENQ
jgi:hypothetical protein